MQNSHIQRRCRQFPPVQQVTGNVALHPAAQVNSDPVMLSIHVSVVPTPQSSRGKERLTRDDQIGKVGELEQVDEYRVEAICLGRETTVKAVEALKK
jgi:hypothetical protein